MWAVFGKSRGVGGHMKNPFRGGGGYGYFLEPHILTRGILPFDAVKSMATVKFI